MDSGTQCVGSSITLHGIFYQLLSVALSGNLNARSAVVKWLSDKIVDQFGEAPKGTHKFIGKYATEIVISEIAGKTPLKNYEQKLVNIEDIEFQSRRIKRCNWQPAQITKLVQI